jgi:hypothetical protein
VSQCEVNSLVEGDAHGRLRYSSAREQGHERQRETSKIAFYGEVPVFHGTRAAGTLASECTASYKELIKIKERKERDQQAGGGRIQIAKVSVTAAGTGGRTGEFFAVSKG